MPRNPKKETVQESAEEVTQEASAEEAGEVTAAEARNALLEDYEGSGLDFLKLDIAKREYNHERHPNLIDEENPLSEGFFADRWSDFDESVFNENKGEWMRFDNGLWVRGEAEAHKMMRGVIEYSLQGTAHHRAAVNEKTDYATEYVKLKKMFDKASIIEGSLRIARTPERVIRMENLDSNPDTLGLPDGKIMDLKTGEIRNAKPNDQLSRRVNLFPEEKPPSRWLRFLDESLLGYSDSSKEVKEYVRLFCGYMLTGHVHEEAFIFAYGQPGTGKSTFAETLGYVMGNYTVALDGGKLASRTDNQHRQWITRLAGARLAKVAELPQGGKWNATDLNAVISGEPIVANFMRQNDFEFVSVAKLLILGNFKPRVDSQSGIFRRMRLLDLDTTPKKKDKSLKFKLRAEGPQILGWMVQACRDWYKNGLPEMPATMNESVVEYQRDQNSVAQFVDDQCNKGDGLQTLMSTLYDAYKKWCEKGGYAPVNLTTFGNRLREMGHKKYQSNGKYYRLGIALDDGTITYGDAPPF